MPSLPKKKNMSLTLEDLKDKLKQLDSVLLLEVLEIDSEELVEAFVDAIELRFDQLAEEFEEEEDD